MEQEKLSSRRNYSAQFRALVLEQCASPGASVAKVALSHGMNANVVHRWRREARDSAGSVSVRQFVAVSVSAPALTQDCADIRIEMRRGATSMAITWPSAAASQCAAWMRQAAAMIRIDALSAVVPVKCVLRVSSDIARFMSSDV